MKTYAWSMGIVTICSLVLMACPIQTPPPPFDVSGNYEGTWSGNATDASQEVEACTLLMTLVQDTTANFPQDHTVSGEITIDYSCIQLPEWAESEPLPSVVQVGGILADDGTFSLLSGGCGTGACVALGLTGQGADTNADGKMDTYSGTWSYRILLAGVEPFGFDGTFEVAAAN